MFGMNRGNSLTMVLRLGAFMGAAVASYRYGASMRHPVIGGVVGVLLAGPIAASVTGMVADAVMQPSTPSALPSGTPPTDRRLT